MKGTGFVELPQAQSANSFTVKLKLLNASITLLDLGTERINRVELSYQHFNVMTR